MSDVISRLYWGEVVHQRFSPRRHRLRYRMFQGLFDLDELSLLSDRLRIFSYNHFNLFSFHDADHGYGGHGPLRDYVDDVLDQAGISLGLGRVSLLCIPRILGFVFNPLSIYYCCDASGLLVAVIYEVNNTFGQRHTYLIPTEQMDNGGVRQSCTKKFYVSPFMDMDMIYDFTLTAPGASITTNVEGRNSKGDRLIFATFTGKRRELSDWSLLGALFAYPLLTFGVVAAIHWEALKLLAKGLRMRARPRPPADAVTVVHQQPSPAA